MFRLPQSLLHRFKNEKIVKAIDLLLQILIVLSIVTFTMETLPDLSEKTRYFLEIVEWITVIIFTLEYFIRIILSKHRMKFIFSFYGIIDLIAILPFYLSLGLDLRSIRLFRMFRLIRILKITRYTEATSRFLEAFKSARDEFVLFFVTMIMVIYLAGVGIYYFENPVQPEIFSSVIHSLWWAVATLTTVGYGDAYPITVGGKVFTFFILIIGLGIVSIPAGIVASALAQVRNK